MVFNVRVLLVKGQRYPKYVIFHSIAGISQTLRKYDHPIRFPVNAVNTPCLVLRNTCMHRLNVKTS
jgi:hypothetical protein